MSSQPRKTRVRNEAKEELKQEILLKGKEMFIQKGTSGFSMKELASKFQMGATNLYNYFNSKRELFYAINTASHTTLQQNFELAINSHHGSQTKLLVKLCELYFESALNDPDSFQLMFSTPAPPQSTKIKKSTPKFQNGSSQGKKSTTPYEDKYNPHRTNHLIDGVVKKAKENGEIWTDVDIDLFSHYLWAIVHGASIVSHYYAVNKKDVYEYLAAKERFRNYVITHLESQLNSQFKKI